MVLMGMTLSWLLVAPSPTASTAVVEPNKVRHVQAQAQQQTAQQNQQTQNRAPAAAPTQAAPRGTVASLGDGFVNMVSPDGRPARVPQAQVQSALAAGGRMA
jgi:hypothetical protein